MLSGSVSSRLAKLAKDSIEAPRCTLFKLLIDETVQGQAMSVEVLCLLETQASDQVGDRRLELAMKALVSEDMPAITVVGAEATLQNCGLVSDESAWTILIDIMGHFIECRRIWSTPRAD